MYPAAAVTTADVTRLRNDAGGLVCIALSDAVAKAPALPDLQDAVDHPITEDPALRYDDRSWFSLRVNHRDTYTGITDRDRSLTIQTLGDLAADPDPAAFRRDFRSPGHVQLLRAAPRLLRDRKGHTELWLALAAAADLPPAVVVREMLDDASGLALSPAATRDMPAAPACPASRARP